MHTAPIKKQLRARRIAIMTACVSWTLIMSATPARAASKPGCTLHDSLKTGLGDIVTELVNAVPLAAKYILIAAGIAMVFLAFTDRLNKVGRIVVGVIGGVLLLSMSSSLSGVIAPDKC